MTEPLSFHTNTVSPRSVYGHTGMQYVALMPPLFQEYSGHEKPARDTLRQRKHLREHAGTPTQYRLFLLHQIHRAEG
jgi:hypothetical protein